MDYVLSVGIDWNGGGPLAVNERLKTRVRERVAAWYRERGEPDEVAERAAALAADDAAPVGTATVLLTENHLTHYLSKAKEA